MSKNISIKQSGVAEDFSDVSTISVPSLGSGEVEWVPEDERRAIVKKITENNTYMPSSDNADGYRAVFVVVDTSKSEITGKKDGQNTTAIVDTFGNIIYMPVN